jgi:glycosyltransferase involved in cell wall biosynthesis
LKKLVFVISYLYDGGAERVTAALTSEISQWKDYQVHLITYQEVGDKEYPLHPNVIRHVLPQLTGGRVNNIVSRIRFLRNTIKQIAPQCVISLGAVHVVGLLSLAMAGLGIPLVLSERNDPARTPQSKVKRLVRLLAFSCCDGVVFQTAGARNYFPRFIQRKSAVICNPITANLPEPFLGRREQKIVNFCRLVPQKNLGLLIDAFSDIAPEFPNHTLWIYGEGPERSGLEQRIADRGLTGRVILPGYSNNIYADINSAALFVSSSDYEGISNSMLEAISLGIPSICTDCPPGGAAETIEHGVNGMLVPTGDRTAMAEAMKAVLGDDALAGRLGLAGAALRDKLSVAAITGQWLRFIQIHSR